MRSVRPLLSLIALTACAAPVTAPSVAPAPVVPVAAALVCPDAAQAEKAYYEAQRLFEKQRYWEAAPAFVISYNFCNHGQVLCAAGQAYRRAQKCSKAAEALTRCLAADIPLSARSQGQKLLANANACAREPEVIAKRGGDENDEAAAATDDATFAAQPWATAAGKAADGAP